MQHCWRKQTPFIIGMHTRAICEQVDITVEKYRDGESSFLIIKVPFRHGKSDIASRYLPPHLLGLFPDEEVLLRTYSSDLSYGFSRFARGLISTPKYRELFPEIHISQESFSVQHWDLESPHIGSMDANALGRATVGKGYAFGILDDYHKNRREAESQVIRDSNWGFFTDDFLTRRAPVSATIILATPWTTDDIIARAEKKMIEDPDFPQFEIIEMPAMSDDYETGYLFSERFPDKWYKSQVAALGSYGTASLLQVRPVARSGNILKIDRIKIHELDELPGALHWARAWDLASTEKQLVKSDPDYTAGILMAIQWRDPPEDSDIGQKIPHIWIRDMLRFRLEAPERDRRIIQTAKMEPGIRIGTESVAGYKDTYTRLAELLQGIRSVEKVTPPGDLLLRVNPVEPIFEAGHVHLIRGDWNREFLQEAGDYNSGAHDDQVAALVTAWEMLGKRAASLGKQPTTRKPITAGMRRQEF